VWTLHERRLVHRQAYRRKKNPRTLVYSNQTIQVIQKKDIIRQQGKPKSEKKENGSPGGSRPKYPVDQGETSCDQAGSTLPEVYRLRDWELFGVSLPVHKSSREQTAAHPHRFSLITDHSTVINIKKKKKKKKKKTQQEVSRKTLKMAVAEKQKKPKHVNQ
jgi:hypothetical protein